MNSYKVVMAFREDMDSEERSAVLELYGLREVGSVAKEGVLYRTLKPVAHPPLFSLGEIRAELDGIDRITKLAIVPAHVVVHKHGDDDNTPIEDLAEKDQIMSYEDDELFGLLRHKNQEGAEKHVAASVLTANGLSTWRDMVNQEMSKFLADKNYIPIMPLPLGEHVTMCAQVIHDNLYKAREERLTQPVSAIPGDVQHVGEEGGQTVNEDLVLTARQTNRAVPLMHDSPERDGITG